MKKSNHFIKRDILRLPKGCQSLNNSLQKSRVAGVSQSFRLYALILVFLFLPALIIGQVISIKTIPLISVQQFALIPSYNAGMGGISIALDDSLADGFLNPARITALAKNLLYIAPYEDSWSERSRFTNWWSGEAGTLHGSTVQALPAGVVRHKEISSGRLRITTGFALSMEHLRHTSRSRQFWDPETQRWNNPLQMKTVNYSMSGIMAVKFPEKGLSVGLGMDAVQLNGVDGIPLLYPGATELIQKGGVTQYRFGVSLDGPREDRLDILVFRKQYHMKQEAVYDWQENIHNKDSERSWLVQLKGRHPVEDGAQVGLELTAQWKWHPKIPDYPAPEIRIPRDPGITKAGRIGIGFSNREGKLLVAIDVSSEIIDSQTWGDTTAPVTTDEGKIIKAGDPLFRNDYFFNNSSIRIGTEYQINKRIRVQAGWATTQYNMDYEHEDYVTGEKIIATPQNLWKEPVLTGGIIARMGNMEWIIQTVKRSGTGMPTQGGVWARWFGFEDTLLAAGDILTPPTGLDFEKTPVVMYQFTVLYWF